MARVDPHLAEQFVPIIALIVTFGAPVSIVFLLKYFKYRHRELEAELEARRMLSERDKAQLEARIERLENALFARLPAATAPVAPQVEGRESLYEPPPLPPLEGRGEPGKRDPTR